MRFRFDKFLPMTLEKKIATYEIHKVFIITGRGITFLGRTLDGEIFSAGDYIEFQFNEQLLKKKINGIDNSVRVERGDPNVGIIIETESESEIAQLRSWNPKCTIGKIYSAI